LLVLKRAFRRCKRVVGKSWRERRQALL
jgi:hypothetical protein